MKKFKFSVFCLSMLFLLVLGGCSDDNNEVTPGEGPGSEVTIEIESGKGDEGSAIYATSATISLNLKGVETYTAVVNYCVAKRSLFSIIDSLSKAFAWFASFLSTVTTTLNQFK